MKLTIETGRLMTDRKIIEDLRMGKSGRFIEAALKRGDKRIKKVRALASAKGYLERDAALPPFPEPLFETKERLATVPSDLETRLRRAKVRTERLQAAGEAWCAPSTQHNKGAAPL